MSWGIIGGGFGLYGYLPALLGVAGSDRISTLERYRSFIRSREDIAHYESRLEFVENEEGLVADCDRVIIAKRPADQESLVSAIVASGWGGSLLLEKPLARDPKGALALVRRLRSAKIGFAVGYTLLETKWAAEMQRVFSQALPDTVRISWRFLAHHYKNDLHNWKRIPDEGGGVLRFYGNHLVALLSTLGTWVPTKCSPWLITGEDPYLRLELSCAASVASIECDSAWPGKPCFEISIEKDGRSLFEFVGQDPFEGAGAAHRQDVRVGYLQSILKRLAVGQFLSAEENGRRIELWRQIEQLRLCEDRLEK